MTYKGLEALIRALRDLGIRMRIHPQHEVKPQNVSHDALDLMWSEKDEPLVVYLQSTTFRAPAADASGEYDELSMERLIIERYYVPGDD